METVFARPAADPDGGAASAGTTRMARAQAPSHLHAVPDHRAAAWVLDAEALHAEFDDLFAAIDGPTGLEPLRERAAAIWRSVDPVVRGYVGSFPTQTPDEWDAGFEEAHLGEWYRLLIGAHLSPTPGFRWPVRLRNRLPDLGWTATETRRLVRGRELAALAARYGAPAPAAALAIVLVHGTKGWLGPDELACLAARFETMPRTAFRANQHLIPLVEDAYEVVTAALAATTGSTTGRVLLLAC